MLSTEFLVTSLVVVLIPGTGVIYTISSGLFGGWRASIAAAVGCTAGIIPHLTASILGLSALLHMSAIAFQAVKFAGIAYLLYLAWMMWRESGPLQLKEQPSAKSLLQIAKRGFLINILNPKLSIFFLAFLPLFVVESTYSSTFQLVCLSLIFMLMTQVVFIIYGISASGIRTYLTRSPHITTWLQKSFAAIFAALGVKLALTEQ